MGNNFRTDPASSGVRSGIAFGLLAALIWGAWPVFSRLAVGPAGAALQTHDVAALRFTVAGLILLPVVWRRRALGLGWGRALVLAFGAGVPYIWVTVKGLESAPASHAGIIVPSVMLAASSLGAWWVLGDRPGPRRLSGLGLIVMGVVLVGWRSVAQGDGMFAGGHLLFVAGGCLWALYTVASRRWSVDPIHATALVSVISMIAYLPVYLIAGGSALGAAPVSEVLFQAVFQGAVTGILALLFYTRAVAALGAARGAVFAALVPGVAVLLSWPVLGEAPGWPELSGILLVTAGMCLVLGLVKTKTVSQGLLVTPHLR